MLIYIPDLGFPDVPIWTLYLSGLPGLFGGNFDVGLAMLFASYTDVMPSASERASLFFLTTSMQYLAQIFCPSIGAWLMNLDGRGGTPEVNMIVSLSLAGIAALLAIFAFPETFQESRKGKDVSAENPDTEPSSTQLQQAEGGTEAPRSWLQRFARPFSSPDVNPIDIAILCLSICFAATGIKAIDMYALVQYPVIKLGWTFPQASEVVSIQGFLMLIHFSIFLPFLNRVAVSRLGSPGRASFAIMTGSAILLALGALVMGISETGAKFISGVVVYLFGEGLPTATQAYIVSLVEKASAARVMATLSMASIFGKVSASLLFPKLLALGMDTHVDILVGLPLFVSAALFVASALCVSFVGLKVRIEQYVRGKGRAS